MEYMCNLVPVMGNNRHFKGLSTQKNYTYSEKCIYIYAIRRNIVTRWQKVRNTAGRRDWDVIQNKKWFFYDFLLFPAMKQLVSIWVGAPTTNIASHWISRNQTSR